MEAKEKAEQLIYQFKYCNGRFSSKVNLDAKQCALICVYEIMRVILCEDCTSCVEEYWQQVKKEINKL